MTDDPTRASEFPPRDQVNWNLLKVVEDRPHPLVNNDWKPPDVADPGWLIEMFYRARNVHHLLDLAGVPHGYSLDTRGIDNRTLIAIMAMGNLRERLVRVSGWHARETGPAGTVGDYCTECGHRWPCDSRRMADGTFTEEDDADHG
jgi:hypothetical protein